jgi:hypothetical protein
MEDGQDHRQNHGDDGQRKHAAEREDIAVDHDPHPVYVV